ncbi:DUF6705 family protein [Flavobacterium sp.]|uniref:DUF6705 family protein n=1 Tax=Flavobacterium sp. TaxID=239 RepID=UPI003BEB2EFB
MKTIYLTLIVLFTTISTNAQTTTIDIDSGFTPMDVSPGTYLKDINYTFDNFLGTWKYQNGNEILIFKLEKVEMYFYTEYETYYDFIKGNYSYSTDGGNTYIVNTIQQNLGNNNPDINPLFSCGPETPLKDKMPFYDIIYQKNAYATFTFQNNNFNQLHLKLKNKGGGYILPATPPNPAFCIPNNVTLIKQ